MRYILLALELKMPKLRRIGSNSTPIRDDTPDNFDVEDECGLSVYDFNGHCVVQEPPNSQPLFSQ